MGKKYIWTSLEFRSRLRNLVGMDNNDWKKGWVQFMVRRSGSSINPGRGKWNLLTQMKSTSDSQTLLVSPSFHLAGNLSGCWKGATGPA